MKYIREIKKIFKYLNFLIENKRLDTYVVTRRETRCSLIDKL